LLGSTEEIIGGEFINAVRSSGLNVHGICISQPDPAFNSKISGDRVRFLTNRNFTSAELKEFREGNIPVITAANVRAQQLCAQLGKPIIVITRKPRDEQRGGDFSTMEALASPGPPAPAVNAEGGKMADIPPPYPEAGSGSGGGGGGYGYGSGAYDYGSRGVSDAPDTKKRTFGSLNAKTIGCFPPLKRRLG
jgi:hypothetical protein